MCVGGWGGVGGGGGGGCKYLDENIYAVASCRDPYGLP